MTGEDAVAAWMRPVYVIRGLVFYIGYAMGVVVIGCTAFVLGFFLSPERVARWVSQFGRFALWWAKCVCGIRHDLSGAEHIPETPCLVASNHQSAWETYYSGVLFQPQAPVLKQELTRIPFFGWGLKPLKPIAIDRSKPSTALKQLLRQGADRLKGGWWVVIYPEGTRVRRGQPSRYTKGAAMLAVRAGVPVLPMAHTAGRCWPAGHFSKYPGTIHVELGPLIPTQGRSADDVHEELERWIRSKAAELESRYGAPTCVAD